MSSGTWFWLLVCGMVLFLLRVLMVSVQGAKPRTARIRLMCVLGSGGHTTEMIRLLRQVDKARFTPRSYVAARDDPMSVSKIRSFEGLEDMKVHLVTRARHVGQPYYTALFTSLWCCMESVVVVWREKPAMLLVNGPGTCVPVVLACWVFRTLGFFRCRIVYVESFCRVRSLSLSARMLMPFVDRVMTLWKTTVPDAPSRASQPSAKVQYIGPVL
ncbi:oligosaccharide biosynthesis protein Alg14-like [Kipferlia bialata]|uniref:UDP-N-acetylglucosamine transferase subunit ALG14 n=1 Tax=Kipferlia bialata TaxID=797122 RepID=A0A9K3D1C4_9EUKA|nr:oligosaccharide biosynthesis protein Alg14-like [Kipferlia bialata]|eukprot:g8057.t1